MLGKLGLMWWHRSLLSGTQNMAAREQLECATFQRAFRERTIPEDPSYEVHKVQIT